MKPALPSLSLKLPPELAAKLDAMTPEKREESIKFASRLAAIKLGRQVTGQMDLTKPFDPKAKAK